MNIITKFEDFSDFDFKGKFIYSFLSHEFEDHNMILQKVP
jgi:hypothetical protein